MVHVKGEKPTRVIVGMKVRKRVQSWPTWTISSVALDLFGAGSVTLRWTMDHLETLHQTTASDLTSGSWELVEDFNDEAKS